MLKDVNAKSQFLTPRYSCMTYWHMSYTKLVCRNSVVSSDGLNRVHQGKAASPNISEQVLVQKSSDKRCSPGLGLDLLSKTSSLREDMAESGLQDF